MKNAGRELGRRAREFLRWWLGELAALVPGGAERLLAGGRQDLVLEVAREDGAEVVRAELGASRAAGPLERLERTEVGALAAAARRVVLRLAPQAVLRKPVRLPLAAEENLRQVLGFEMSRQTPFAAEDVYFDYRVTGRDRAAKRLELELLVARRERLDRLLDRLAGAGLHIDSVSLAGDDGEEPFELLPVGRAARRGGVRRALKPALAALALVLAVALALLPGVQRAQLARQLEPEVEQARRSALAVRELQEQIERLDASLQFVVREKGAAAQVIEIIEEVTRLLPDDTWLSEFQLVGRELQMRGEAPAAARLVSLFEATDRFANVRFRSPVTQAVGRETERFHLAAEIAGEGAQ